MSSATIDWIKRGIPSALPYLSFRSPGQYCSGWPCGNPWCCRYFFCTRTLMLACSLSPCIYSELFTTNQSKHSTWTLSKRVEGGSFLRGGDLIEGMGIRTGTTQSQRGGGDTHKFSLFFQLVLSAGGESGVLYICVCFDVPGVPPCTLVLCDVSFAWHV